MRSNKCLTLRQASFRHLFTLGSLTAFIHRVTVNEEHELFGKEWRYSNLRCYFNLERICKIKEPSLLIQLTGLHCAERYILISSLFSWQRLWRNPGYLVRRMQWGEAGETPIMRSSVLFTLRDDSLAGCCAMSSRTNWQTFQRCLLPSSGRWWKQ
jgi:hypothetical protein